MRGHLLLRQLCSHIKHLLQAMALGEWAGSCLAFWASATILTWAAVRLSQAAVLWASG